MVVTRRGAIASGLAAGLAGCAGQDIVPVSPSVGAEAAYGFADLAPLDLDPANLTKITVCLRPFRTSGPRLEVDRAGQRVLIHNYGHGGSGWSLAWGYAEAARDLVARSRPSAITVVGAGAIGLTTAIAIAETGVRVTIAARDMPMESASAKATGVWSPSSRIGLVGAVSPQFAALWEEFARRSYARHLRYVGRVGHPVEFTPRFYVRSGAPEPQLSVQPDGAASFLHIDRNLRGLTPPWNERERHPFPTEYGVRGGLVMTFNIAEYTRQLVEDFRAMGGRIERMNLNSREDFSSLPGDAIVNCSGLGAKTLVGDDALIPVRGQIAWMAPQTDRLYGVHHRGVMALSRRDGLLIQETGGSDFFGLGDDNEVPDRDEFLTARAKIAPMFAW